ncbi:hypothetical protein HZA85_00080 [Candidatus Uhrbacteria bacterium]|nr:hypothetical protein [Candidatus Uhrbacteria bacterium]
METPFPLRYTRPEIPVVDLDRFRAGQMTERELVEVTGAFARLGVICLRDARVTSRIQENFRRTMIGIHGASPQEQAALDGKDVGYQFGMTPPGTELPLDHSAWVATLPSEHRPLTVAGRPDLKARFMWALGVRPTNTPWPNVNTRAKIPERFAHIAGPLNTWGGCMLAAAYDIMQIISIGMGLKRCTLSRMLEGGPHILGPTGSNFATVQLGQVLAGLHYDFNAITVHGQTNIRALVCWTLDGQPFLVEVPDGCLLAQAGKSLEWVTGGRFFAGKHEVLGTPEALADAAAIVARGERPIRVSSNLFVHFATRWVMRPLGHFATAQTLLQYPPIYAGDFESVELARIKLFPSSELARGDRVPPQYRARMARLRVA